MNSISKNIGLGVFTRQSCCTRRPLKPYSLGAMVAFVFIAMLLSCQKEVHINLGTSPEQVVVQGAIETNIPPYVILTSTIGFFSNINLATLQNSFLHGAIVTVSDGSTTTTLKEYSIDTGNNNKFYIYSVDTTNLANIMYGQVGKFYTLTIKYNGNTYTSVTKIPYPKGIDTMWFGTPTFKNKSTPDSAVELFANYTDPDTPGNYVRYFTQRNNEQFYPAGIFTDDLVNGENIRNIDLFAGYDDSTKANGDSLQYFYPGDSVTLKWCEIDKAVYDFWNTYQFASNAIGNPFSSPINIKSNITNGALGVWCGYGSVLTTKVVPH